MIKKHCWIPSHLNKMDVQGLVSLFERDPLYDLTMNAARVRHPDMLPILALWRFVLEEWERDVWFKQNDQRYIIDSDIMLKADNGDWSNEFFQGSPIYSMLRRRTLMQVDYISKDKQELRDLVGYHHSEMSVAKSSWKKTRVHPRHFWNKPRDHPRHLLNFPPEILHRILEFIVTAPEQTVEPITVTLEFSRSYYNLLPDRTQIKDRMYPFVENLNTVVNIPCHDENGPYTKLKMVHRPVIDATCLRVCQLFRNIGSEFLYGHNVLQFRMPWHHEYDGPINLRDENNQIYRPWPNQPVYVAENSTKWTESIDKAILCIKTQSHFKELPRWVFYDRFVMFLFAIGPESSALLRTLNFVGGVKSHECDAYQHTRHTCLHDLVASMRIYIKIINVLCPNVWKVNLITWSDPYIRGSEERLEAHNNTLTAFLETEFRSLKYVKEIAIYAAGDRFIVWRNRRSGWEVMPPSWVDPIVTSRDSVCFAPTIDWFRERARKL